MKLLFVHVKLGLGGIALTTFHKMNYLAENTDFEIHYLSEKKNDVEVEVKLHKRIQVHCLDFEKVYQKKEYRLFFIDSLLLRKKAINLLQSFIDKIQPDVITSLDDRTPRKLIPFIETSAIKVLEFRDTIYRKGVNRKLRNQSQLSQLKSEIHPLNLIYGNSKRIHNKYDYAIILTKEDLEDRKYLQIKKRQIYNCFSQPDTVSKFDSRDKVIIAVGRLVAEKNFEDLLKAVYLIKDQISPWKIYIYGKGIHENILSQAIKDDGLSEIVYLKGYTYDLQKIYNNSKILISTSITEAFGKTVLEALTYKIPVISYNCKFGPKEIIADGVNGYLIDFDVQELADKILKLTSNPGLLNQFSKNTSQDLHKFEEEKIMNEWIDFYNSIVKNKIEKALLSTSKQFH